MKSTFSSTRCTKVPKVAPAGNSERSEVAASLHLLGHQGVASAPLALVSSRPGAAGPAGSSLVPVSSGSLPTSSGPLTEPCASAVMLV